MSADVHDYSRKLRHPAVHAAVEVTVRADVAKRRGSLRDALLPRLAAARAPLSINLDLTVACNYACGHCIDLPMLNTGHRFSEGDALRSLTVLRLAGLRSVILIGGGEPTMHPRFGEVVAAVKALGLQCAIVSNGSNNERIREVARYFTRGDWVRLSLDAATNHTFQEMHAPRRKSLTLEKICASASTIKGENAAFTLGFSYIVAWEGSSVTGRSVADNIDEMAAAARLAKGSGFDFIAFKPLLDRDASGGERVGFLDEAAGRRALQQRLTEQLDAARAVADGRFRVLVSVNLEAIDDGSDAEQLRRQPRRCHMHLMRQVLTPTGVYGCPVYRDQSKDQIGAPDLYSSADDFLTGHRLMRELHERFDAEVECEKMSCIYNATNWWLESVRNGAAIVPSDPTLDFFL